MNVLYGVVFVLAFLGIGPMEIGIAMVVILLLFGSSKLPKLARSEGRSATEFKKGVAGIDEESDAGASKESSEPEESND